MSFDAEEFGKQVREYRGVQGIRAAAQEVGTSPSTLSRVENGHVPDVELLEKICAWMGQSPAAVWSASVVQDHQQASVHLRKAPTVSVETAKALGELIIHVQNAVRARDRA